MCKSIIKKSEKTKQKSYQSSNWKRGILIKSNFKLFFVKNFINFFFFLNYFLLKILLILFFFFKVVKIFRVYLQNGTFTAVEMSALSTAKDMAEEVVRFS